VRYGLTLFLVVLMAAVPLTAIADTDSCEQAMRDAERDVKSGLWRNVSCFTACLFTPLFGLGVVGLAYFAEPRVPSENFLGKPLDYVAAYTDCYKDQAKSIRTDEALGGCLVGSLTWIGMVGAASIIILASSIPYW
jgi:hypothetical protein